MRVPVPAERSGPERRRGSPAAREKAIATVRAMRDQKANTYSRSASELAR